MAITIRSTTGTYLGDPNGIFVNEETTVDGSSNTLTIDGEMSYYGNQYALSGSWTMPTPNTSTQYCSLQVSSTGTLTFYSDSTGNCLTLQTGNVLVLYSETIPANAVNDQSFTTDTEPVLD